MADDREDRTRFIAYIERTGLVSAMNDTKWREAITCLQHIPGFYAEFRVRCIRDPADSPLHRQRSFPWHVPTYREIEWLDVDPMIRSPSGAVDRGRAKDFTDVLVAALKGIPVPISCEDGCVRVWGYFRPSMMPSLL